MGAVRQDAWLACRLANRKLGHDSHGQVSHKNRAIGDGNQSPARQYSVTSPSDLLWHNLP